MWMTKSQKLASWEIENEILNFVQNWTEIVLELIA